MKLGGNDSTGCTDRWSGGLRGYSLAALRVTLRIRYGGTEKLEKFWGLLTWSSVRCGERVGGWDTETKQGGETRASVVYQIHKRHR